MALNFLNTPFIPQQQVKLMLIDGRVREDILYKLSSFNIDCILTDRCTSLHSSISYHPDIQLHPLGDDKLVISPNMYENIKAKLQQFSFNTICGSSFLKSNYPENIAYNVARIGNFCFHNLKYTDAVLSLYLQNKGLQFINIAQGYSKCSVTVINYTAIVTSDKGIHKAALKNGIDSLLISPGYIELENQPYGFIGGCTGLISPDVLAVTGSLKNHPDCKRIFEFCAKHKVEIIFLSDRIPIDLGSLIPLLEAKK